MPARGDSIWTWGRRGLAAILLALVFSASALAAETLRLAVDTDRIEMAGHWDVFRDTDRSLSIDEVQRPEHADRFVPLPTHLAAGFTSDVFWLRTTIERLPGAGDEWWLEAEMAYLDHVDLYLPDGRGGFSVQRQGDRRPFAERPIPYRNFLFKLVLPEAAPQTVFLRVASTSTVALRTYLWQPKAFAPAVARETVGMGILHGVMIALIIFALVQFLATRDVVYLYYLYYTATCEIMFFSFNGYAAQFLLPTQPAALNILTGTSVCLSVSFGALVSYTILDFKQHFPRLLRFYQATALIALGCVGFVLADQYHIAARIANPLAGVLLVITPAFALLLALRGDRVAVVYLLAFLVYITAQILITMRNLGLVQTPLGVDWMMQIGYCLHIVLLSMGMVQRVKIFEHEKEAAQTTLLETLRRSERELEERVVNRTTELAATNRTLAAEITERRAAEQRVRENEYLVRAVLDAAPFPMMVTEFEGGDLLFLNRPADELLGLQPASGSGRNIIDFYDSPSERGTILGMLSRDGVVLNHEIRMRRSDGERRWLLTSAVRFRYGTHDAILTCCNDISLRKELEESLRRAHRRSEAALEAERRAMREQRNFLAMVSHEFRSPLAIIEASAQLLALYLKADQKDASDEIDKIRRAVRRTTSLIDTCLSDDWLDSTVMTLKNTSLDLERLLAEVCDEKRTLTGSQRLIVDLCSAPPILGDGTLLRVVFSNLLDNAIKYAPPLSQIDVRMTCTDHEVTVAVSDRGPGIVPNEQESIFEKFFRSTASGQTSGAGLGLYIVKRIVDLHGARIAVNSQPGAGATFTVHFPLHAEPEMADDAPMSATAAS